MYRTLAETLLASFDLLEIMEMNDLTEELVLEILIEGGMIDQPERIVREFEVSERD
jgi:hypothetical protein